MCEKSKAKSTCDLEITPAMMEAGKEAYWLYARDRDADMTAFAIFKAMVAASPSLKRFRVVESR